MRGFMGGFVVLCVVWIIELLPTHAILEHLTLRESCLVDCHST